jgi:thiamine pyrophosphate-dependent acetolactate synthase large subunit-like protein
MGGFGIRVHHPGEIQGALDKAVASGKPAVVDVVSDINSIAHRAWTPSQPFPAKAYAIENK